MTDTDVAFLLYYRSCSCDRHDLYLPSIPASLQTGFCHMSSVRSTSDGRGPVTPKRVPDREEQGKPSKDARRGRCHPLEASFWPLWMTPLPQNTITEYRIQRDHRSVDARGQPVGEKRRLPGDQRLANRRSAASVRGHAHAHTLYWSQLMTRACTRQPGRGERVAL